MRFHSRVALAAILLTASVATISAQRELRRAFAQVTDSSGAPVLDLGAKDFVLVEAGAIKEIVRASRALDPVRIALVVDSSSVEAISSANAGGSLIDMRRGLQTFLNTVPQEHEVGLFTTGRQMRARVPPTTDRNRLLRAAAEYSSDGGGNTLINSIREIDERFMRQPTNVWPIWVVVTMDGPEMSRPQPSEETWVRLVHGFVARGASVNAVAVQFPGQYTGGSMATEAVVSLTEHTAGLYFPITGSTGQLPERLERIAQHIVEGDRLMTSKYVIEYYSDFKLPLGDLSVVAHRGDVRVVASLTRPF